METALKVLLSEAAIAVRVRELAGQISEDYRQAGSLLLVGVLRGCYMFLADLSRRLTIPCRIDFIAVSSYGQSTTSGAVRLIMDLRSDIAAQHVLIVEDIIDTGRTLEYLTRLLGARRPTSLKTCSLLIKEQSIRRGIRVDYLGFTIPDDWLVGYGLDYADRFRALPYIATLSPAARKIHG